MHWRKKRRYRIDSTTTLTWVAAVLFNTVVYVAIYRAMMRRMMIVIAKLFVG